MGMPAAEAVPAAVDENQVTARLQHVEILSLLAQSEGVAALERLAHNLRGTPQDGVCAVRPAPPYEDFESVTTIALVPADDELDDEPLSARAFEPDGESFGGDVSDGVPIEIGVPVRGPSSAAPSRWRGLALAVVLLATTVAAYVGYGALLQQGQP